MDRLIEATEEQLGERTQAMTVDITALIEKHRIDLPGVNIMAVISAALGSVIAALPEDLDLELVMRICNESQLKGFQHQREVMYGLGATKQ